MTARNLLAAAAASALLVAAPAHAAYSGTVAGTTATLTGDAADDFVAITKDGGELRHNLAGFDSIADFDSAPGVQTLADTAATHLTINAGDGIDSIQLGTPTTVFLSKFTVDGGGGADFLTTPSGTDGADTVTLAGNTISGVSSGQVDYTAATDQVVVGLRGGADVVNVNAAAVSQTVVTGGEGDDTVKLAEGAGLGGASHFRGGAGVDTVDYSAWTTPVTVDLSKTARFDAELTAAAAVPPSGSSADGDAVVEFTNLATNTFSYELNVDGIAAANIPDAAIRSGATGVNGASLFSFGAGATWDVPGASTSDENVTDTDVTEPALRAGNTYIAVHTTAHPDGEIRGQLTLHPDYGYGGPATGISYVNTVETIIGGSGADTLKGTLLANHIEGRGGADQIDCGAGQDTEISDLTDTVTGCEALVGSATVTGVDPASPAHNLGPKVKGTASPAGANVRIYTNATCTPPAAATGTAADFAGAGIAVTVADGSLTTFYATVADTVNESACSTTSASYQEIAGTPAPAPTPVPTPAPTPTSTPKPAPLGTVSALKPKASGRGARITLDTGATASCPAGATSACRVTATATAKKKSLGRLSANATRGRGLRVRIKLSSKQTAAFRKARKLKITFRITMTVPGGRPVTRTRTVTLKAPARRR